MARRPFSLRYERRRRCRIATVVVGVTSRSSQTPAFNQLVCSCKRFIRSTTVFAKECILQLLVVRGTQFDKSIVRGKMSPQWPSGFHVQLAKHDWRCDFLVTIHLRMGFMLRNHTPRTARQLLTPAPPVAPSSLASIDPRCQSNLLRCTTSSHSAVSYRRPSCPAKRLFQANNILRQESTSSLPRSMISVAYDDPGLPLSVGLDDNYCGRQCGIGQQATWCQCHKNLGVVVGPNKNADL
jgi:hypothetical protein